MSTSLILIIVLGVTIIGSMLVYFLFLNKKESDEAEQEDIFKKQVLGKEIDTNDLFNNRKNRTETNSNILSETKKKRKKINNSKKWVVTESYSDDVKKIPEQKIFINPETINVIKEKEKEIELSNVSKLKPLILVVDDSMVVRKYVGDLLKKNNYDVVTKNDGWEAMSFLNSSNQIPEAILTDIEMPNMDGFQLIDSIRKEEKYNKLPIMVMSAHAESHLKLMENEQSQGFIGKPFEDNDLLEQLGYLINNT